MAWKCLQRGQQSVTKPDYVSDSSSETHSLQLLVPRTPALSGPILAGSVAVGESLLGPAVTKAVTKATLGGLYQVNPAPTVHTHAVSSCSSRKASLL